MYPLGAGGGVRIGGGAGIRLQHVNASSLA